MKLRGDSELLKLLNERGAWKQPEYRQPSFDPQQVDAAVRAWASAHISDPFAGARMRLYLANGYELPSDILADGNRLIAMRQQAKKGNGHGA